MTLFNLSLHASVHVDVFQYTSVHVCACVCVTSCVITRVLQGSVHCVFERGSHFYLALTIQQPDWTVRPQGHTSPLAPHISF